MNTHTPAPWKVLIDEDNKYPLSVIDPATENHPQGPVHICNINPNLGTESEANAALIAAAPDLLAVLCEMLGAAETDLLDDKSNVWRSAMNDARTAIAKAKGE